MIIGSVPELYLRKVGILIFSSDSGSYQAIKESCTIWLSPGLEQIGIDQIVGMSSVIISGIVQCMYHLDNVKIWQTYNT